MDKTPSPKVRRERRATALGTKTISQIIGFRLPQELAREVKVEASRRGISLKALFVEMWDQYKRQNKQ